MFFHQQLSPASPPTASISFSTSAASEHYSSDTYQYVHIDQTRYIQPAMELKDFFKFDYDASSASTRIYYMVVTIITSFLEFSHFFFFFLAGWLADRFSVVMLGSRASCWRRGCEETLLL